MTAGGPSISHRRFPRIWLANASRPRTSHMTPRGACGVRARLSRSCSEVTASGSSQRPEVSPGLALEHDQLLDGLGTVLRRLCGYFPVVLRAAAFSSDAETGERVVGRGCSVWQSKPMSAGLSLGHGLTPVSMSPAQCTTGGRVKYAIGQTHPEPCGSGRS